MSEFIGWMGKPDSDEGKSGPVLDQDRRETGWYTITARWKARKDSPWSSTILQVEGRRSGMGAFKGRSTGPGSAITGVYTERYHERNPERRKPHAKASHFDRRVKHPVWPYVVRLYNTRTGKHDIFHSWHNTWAGARAEAKRLNAPGIRWS